MGSGGKGEATTGLGSGEATTAIGSGWLWASATGASQKLAPLAAIAERIRAGGSNIRIAPSFALSPGMGYRAMARRSHLLCVFPNCA
jgi:hypothetical protein